MTTQDKLREFVERWKVSKDDGTRVCAMELEEAIRNSGDSGEWVLVPREPTQEMLFAAQQTNGKKQLPRFSVLRTRWSAMVDAAPTLPADGSDK